MYIVLHGRWMGHAFGGNAERAAHFRKQAELVTEDDVWRRKALLFVEAELFALTGDLHGLGRTCDAIGELAVEIEGWRPWHAWARAEVERLRGDFETAENEVERALQLAPAGQHRAFLLAAPLRAELRLLRGDAAAAVHFAEEALAAIAIHGLDRTAIVELERVRSLGASALGHHDASHSAVERAFVLARELEYGGLPLATLHDASARIALAAGQHEACLSALNALREQLAQADAPSFIHAYEALRQEAARIASVELPAAGFLPRTDVAISTEVATQVKMRMAVIDERAERATLALKLLLEDVGASAGHLFLFDGGGLFAAASTEAASAPENLLEAAQRYLAFELESTDTDAVTVDELASAPESSRSFKTSDSAFGPLLLAHAAGESQAVTGVALICRGGGVFKVPRGELVRAVSHCLWLAGDSVPHTL
jgi:hypothetical protein